MVEYVRFQRDNVAICDFGWYRCRDRGDSRMGVGE